MQEMDWVEVVVEKSQYASHGVHKGMQGWICDERNIENGWLVNFPQYGEKDDIATIAVQEEDLHLLPDGMNAAANEEIRVRFEALEKDEGVENISEGLSQILCKHRNAVQIEQNLFKAEVAQAAAALFSK